MIAVQQPDPRDHPLLIVDCGETPRCGGCEACLRLAGRLPAAPAVDPDLICPACGAVGFGNASCPTCHLEWQGTWGHTPCAVCIPPPAAETDEWELGPVALLEAVISWDYDAALTMRPDPGSWARLAYLTAEARRILGDAQKAIARELAEVVPYSQPQDWPDVPPFTLRGGSTRKEWDHDGIRAKAIPAIADDMGVTVRAVEEVVTRWCDLATPGWKVGREPKGDDPGSGMRRLGLDPDEYCKKTPGAPSVQFDDPS